MAGKHGAAGAATAAATRRLGTTPTRGPGPSCSPQAARYNCSCQLHGGRWALQRLHSVSRKLAASGAHRCSSAAQGVDVQVMPSACGVLGRPLVEAGRQHCAGSAWGCLEAPIGAAHALSFVASYSIAIAYPDCCLPDLWPPKRFRSLPPRPFQHSLTHCQIRSSGANVDQTSAAMSGEPRNEDEVVARFQQVRTAPWGCTAPVHAMCVPVTHRRHCLSCRRRRCCRSSPHPVKRPPHCHRSCWRSVTS